VTDTNLNSKFENGSPNPGKVTAPPSFAFPVSTNSFPNAVFESGRASLPEGGQGESRPEAVNTRAAGQRLGANGIPNSEVRIPNAESNGSDIGIPIPDSRSQADDSQFKIQDSRNQLPESRVDVPGSIIKTQDPASNGPSSTGQVQGAISQVANCRLLIPLLSSQQLQFLMRVAPAALESERAYQIPASVTLAQAILESATSAGWGSSSLFRIANNPFGIKYEHYGSGDRVIGQSDDRTNSGHGQPQHGDPLITAGATPPTDSSLRSGPALQPLTRTADHPLTRPPDRPITSAYGAFDAETWEIVNGQKKVMTAQFQRFPNLTEAFRAHAQLLCSPHYRPAFAVRHDWKQFAERLGPKSSPLDLEHCGYSTNPSYSASLIKLVELYRLHDPRAVQWLATGIDPGRAVGSQ